MRMNKTNQKLASAPPQQFASIRVNSRFSLFPVEELDGDILELNIHCEARVHLEGDDAAGEDGLGAFVDQLSHEVAVDAVLHVVSVDDEDDLVPIAGIVEQGFELVAAFRQRGVLALVIGVPDGFFSAHAHRGTASGDAGFVVDRAGEFAAAIDVGLVAADVKGLGLVDFRAELDARVPGGADHLPLEMEFKIDEFFRVLLGGAEDEVGLDRFLFGFAAIDDAILDGPEAFETFPAGQVFAVEEADEAIGIGLAEFRGLVVGVEGSEAEREGGSGDEGDAGEEMWGGHRAQSVTRAAGRHQW